MDLGDFDFRIINPDLVSFSTSQIRISTNSIFFNVATAAELGYPQSVCLLATSDGAGVAIGTALDERFKELEVPFFDCSKENKTSVQIRDKSFVSALRRELGWSDKATRRAPGILFRQKNLIFFDLTQATRISGRAQKQSVSLTDYPRLSEAVSTLRPAPLQLQAPGA